MWQKVEEQLNAKLPFVVYRKPRDGDVNAVFQNDKAVKRVVDFSRKGFVFASFDTKKAPILLKEDKRLKFQFSADDSSSIF